jgi:hypothetical protein
MISDTAARLALRRRASVVLVALAAAGYATKASAQSDTAAANTPKDDKARFSEAVRLYKAGEFAQALPAFEALASATGSANAELYVAYCLKGLGRHADAYVAFERAARDAGSEERYAETRTAALEEVATLALQVGTLVVSPVETPEGLVVTVDGAVLDSAAFGSHRVLEPGEHHVEARATGRDPLVHDVHVASGETKTVTLYFPERSAAASTPKTSSTDKPGAGLRTAGFVAAGVGGVGLVAFVVGGLEAKSAHDSLESQCGSTPCTDSAHQREADRGQSFQTVANVGLVVGAVGAATSAALLYFGYRTTETTVALAPLPGGAFLGARSRF